MANGIIQFFLGKLMTITWTPQDVAADGTLSDNALGAHTFAGRLDTLDDDHQLTTENISPINAFNANPVPIEIASTYTITELLYATPLVDVTHDGFGFGNVILACAKASLYHKLVFAMKGTTGTAFYTETLYALARNPYSRQIAKGKSVVRATLETVIVVDTSTGLYLANPTLS